MLDVYRHYVEALSSEIALAVRTEWTDPYADQFRHGAGVPGTMTFLIGDRTGIQRFADIGANLGHISAVAGLMGFEVIAVEAMPENHEALEATLNANRLSSAKALNAAASDHAGVVHMFGDAAYARVVEGEGVAVPTVVLDDVFDDFSPDIVKLDIEGHEFAALRGMTRTFARKRPLIIIESAPHLQGGEEGARETLAYLEAQGYDLYLYRTDGTVTPRPSSHPQPVAVVDYLAVPRDWTGPVPEIHRMSEAEEIEIMLREPLDSPVHRAWVEGRAIKGGFRDPRLLAALGL